MLSPTKSRLVLLAAFALVIVGCGGETTDTTQAEATTTTAAEAPPVTIGSPLVGQWERAESTFTELDGMIIEVQGDGATAVILTVPENPYQFQAGDEKWTEITQTADGEFSFQDLVREENTGATSHVEGVITVSDDGNTITMSFPATGTEQEWVRVEGS